MPDLADTVVVSQLANREPPPAAIVPKVQSLVDEVDGARWFSDLSTLAGYNRWSYGTDIHHALAWLENQFEALPGITVTTPSFLMAPTTGYNVVATLPGLTRPDDWYIIGGHYDSVSEVPQSAAPGAEDNASGCAGVLELARIISAHPPAGTVIFICYSGEEQGLHGSTDHASRLVLTGDDDKIKAMINMDMIGYTGDAELDCLLESRSIAQTVVDTLSAAATQYTTLSISISWSAWGSDHVPYLNRSMPAVLTIENDWDVYPYYHTTSDTPDKIVIDMGVQILRMNLAAIADLAGTDAHQIFADGFESGDLAAWDIQVGEAQDRVRRPDRPTRP
jgi:Zn-dependent M28 family amino/carboxypeptidase